MDAELIVVAITGMISAIGGIMSGFAALLVAVKETAS